MTTLAVARVLTIFVALVTMFGALLADFVIPATAIQHMRNDAWPPHAKFHDAQYIVMSILLGAVALTLLVTPCPMWVACAILATPWLGLLGALLFPRTAVHDPEFDNPTILGMHPQVLLGVIMLAVLLAAVLLVVRT
ncbi:DUF6640 family protein [Nocardia stercoris]|uniref:Uncharacterized protein n=1 Tax=Nocardia stercoris TaxID=2483361 RepID=A0A3M2KZN9_9NOCA|nr:DUF6640 family protein [Nocardia stercoris]RMI30126.1 hypothetical protein EBN03_23155 [Nocardia stercoris]